MNIITLIIGICIGFAAVAVIAAIQDEKQIRSEATIRPCTMTDCYFNEDLMCRSLSESWNPALLDNCPDYTED